MVKFLPRAYENFTNNFKLSNILPGGAHCMMNAVNVNGRPFMGPNLYMTPRKCFCVLHFLHRGCSLSIRDSLSFSASSFTQFHQDGHVSFFLYNICFASLNAQY